MRANVRVGNNISSVDEMLHMAMPEASIQATPMDKLVLLTGTVASPDDVAEAAAAGPGSMSANGDAEICRQPASLGDAAAGDAEGAHRRGQPRRCSRRSASTCSAATRTAERSVRHRPGKRHDRRLPGAIRLTGRRFCDVATHQARRWHLGCRQAVRPRPARHARPAADRWSGRRTLAEPNLTALSGETASFLAGGEFPIPVSQGTAPLHRIQAIWRRPRFHADRPCRWPHLDARPSRSQRVERRGLGQARRLRRSGADDAARGNDASSSAPASRS